MLTPHEQELWSLIYDEDEPNYLAAEAFITKYPEENLINTINEDGDSLFMDAASCKPFPVKFIDFILNHPKFDPSYTHPNPEWDQSNFVSLFWLNMPQYIEKFKNHPVMFNTDKKLGYELAKNSLVTNETDLASLKNKNAKPEEIQAKETEIKNLQSILNILLIPTILYAKEKDSAEILTHLVAAGVKLRDSRIDGKPLSFIINPIENPNLVKFYQDKLLKAVEHVPAGSSSAFFKLEQAFKEKAAVEKKLMDAQTEVLKQGLGDLNNLAETLSKSM